MKGGAMRTVAEIRKALQNADEEQYEVLLRALVADERKGVKSALAAARKRLDAQAAEALRLESMYATASALAGGGLAMGLDEVGRGPVAGPLTVAAVVLPDAPRIEGLNDSKQVAPAARTRMAESIKACALAWDIEFIEPHDIDAYGMSACLRTAFGQAIAAIDEQLSGVAAVLLDGNPLHIDPRERNIIKGDAKCAPIAAASIIAKVERDALMCEYAKEYPQYGFDSNKGYGSADHIEAIRTYGLTPVHRASFCHAWAQESLF
jgi:ribonuclease HII